MSLRSLNIPVIDFVGKRKFAMIFSAVLLVLSITSIGFQGLKFGIDFTGGTLIELGYENTADLEDIRSKLSEGDFKGTNVQYFGSDTEVLIQLEPQEVSSAKLSSSIIRMLGDGIDIRRVEFVGPKVGEELTNDGGLAMLYALIGILIYVAFRFEYRFALGSIAALVHDVIITLGIFSILQIEFDLTVLAAILAVIGYSLNDTIVVFDRIRENFLSTRQVEVEPIINEALNQTLSRTLMTSLTTLLVLLALFYLGGEVIHSFAGALLIGVIVGTYSSIYVASSMILALGISKEDMLPSEKEKKEIQVEAEPIINEALNQTLSRTLMTSLTTLLVLLALFYLGGEVIHSFAGALLIGVIVGTYSSIYVASSMILALGISKEDMLPSEKEKKEIDARP